MHRDIAAVASALTESRAPVTEANLWRHEKIVETLMEDYTVLPVRFGTVLSDEEAVLRVLASHYDDFLADLHRVRGRVELGLRVLWDREEKSYQDPAPALESQGEEESGRAYIMARLADEHRRQAQREEADALALELHTPLAERVVESTYQVLVTPQFLLKAAYLVERDAVSAFQKRVEALDAAYPDLRFLCTGPWPAYSFITAGSLPMEKTGRRG